MKSFYQRFKLKHGIGSDWDALIIILVFSLTGSLSVKLAQPLLEWCGIHKETMSPWLFWPLRIIIIFPLYQFLQICIGSSLGQFRFFWEFQKKMYAPMGRLFKGK